MNSTEILAQHSRTAQIRPADIGAHGFAHFDVYIRLMEETEYSFLRSRGLSVILTDERGTIGFPRISSAATIEIPLVIDDEVIIELELKHLDGKQIDYHFRILSGQQRVASGKFRVACCRFPKDRFPYAILMPDFITIALSEKN